MKLSKFKPRYLKVKITEDNKSKAYAYMSFCGLTPNPDEKYYLQDLQASEYRRFVNRITKETDDAIAKCEPIKHLDVAKAIDMLYEFWVNDSALKGGNNYAFKS